MELPETWAVLPQVHWLDAAESTNSVLREMVMASTTAMPHGTLVATANQTAGRGRQGRGWVTPPDTALAASLLLLAGEASDLARNAAARTVAAQSAQTAGQLGNIVLGVSWLPLLAGSAVAASLQPLFQSVDGRGASKRVGVKWPNDVHVRDEDDAMAGRPGAKLCGILSEMLPSGEVIVGFGINLLQEDWQLATERAGSVLASGGEVGGALTLADPRGAELVDRVLASATTELLRLVELAVTDPAAARRRVLRDSVTIGAEVRVHLPNEEIVDGRAVGLDETGALIVDRPTTGQLIVNAADVEHLR